MKLKSKKRLALLSAGLIMITVPLSGCGNDKILTDEDLDSNNHNSAIEAEEIKWIEYDGKDFSVDYLSNWVPRDDRTDNLLTFEAPLDSENDDFKEFFSVAKVGSVEYIGSLDYYFALVLDNIKNDKATIEILESQGTKIVTNDKVGKVYEDVRVIKTRTKVTALDQSRVHDEKVQEETIQPITEPESGDEVVYNVDPDAFKQSNLSDLDVAEPNETLAQLNASADTLEPISGEIETISESTNNYDVNTCIRTYYLINNGGEIFVFVTVSKENEQEKYNSIFDTALASFSCKDGISTMKDGTTYNYYKEKNEETSSDSVGEVETELITEVQKS